MAAFFFSLSPLFHPDGKRNYCGSRRFPLETMEDAASLARALNALSARSPHPTLSEARRRSARIVSEIKIAEKAAYPLISSNVPLLPGTAPRNAIKLFSASIFAIFKFLTVTRSPPMRPAIFLPLITRWGHVAPIEPGWR